MNRALRVWADTNERNCGKGSGRTTGLAKHLGLTQPAVTKIINGSSDIQFKHIRAIIEYTGIPAKELLPEYYELFKESFEIESNFWDNQIREKKEYIKCEIEKTISTLQGLKID